MYDKFVACDGASLPGIESLQNTIRQALDMWDQVSNYS